MTACNLTFDQINVRKIFECIFQEMLIMCQGNIFGDVLSMLSPDGLKRFILQRSQLKVCDHKGHKATSL